MSTEAKTLGIALDKNFNKTIDHAKKSSLELGKSFRYTNKQLADVTKGLLKYKKILVEIKKNQNAVVGSSKRLSKSVTDVGSRYTNARREAKKYRQELGKVQKKENSKKSGKGSSKSSFTGLLKKLGPIGKALGVMKGLTMGASNAAANHLGQVAKAADKLGMSTTAVQEYGYMAKQAGMSQGAMNTALQEQSLRISEAAQGSGEAAEALRQLGLDAEFLTHLSPDQQMELIAESMGSVSTQSEKASLAMKLWGDEGASMLNVVKNGTAGLNEMRAAAHANGGVFSDDDIQKAQKFQKTMATLNTGIAGIGTTLGLAFMPAFTEVGQVIGTLITENQAEIAAFGTIVGAVFTFVGFVFKHTLKIVVGVFKAIGVAIGETVGWIVLKVEKLIGVFKSVGSFFGKVKKLFLGDSDGGDKDEGDAVLDVNSGEVKEKRQNVENAVRESSARQATEQTLAAAHSSNSSSTSINAPISIYASPGMNEEQLGIEVSRQLEARQQAAESRERGRLYD